MKTSDKKSKETKPKYIKKENSYCLVCKNKK